MHASTIDENKTFRGSEINVTIPNGKKAKCINQTFLTKQATALVAKESENNTLITDLRSKIGADDNTGGNGYGDNHLFSGEAEVATDNQEREKNSLHLQRLIKEQNIISSTLDRICKGRYTGMCIKCSKPIPKNRLISVPHASTHANCSNGTY